MDTCCINKEGPGELEKAITSMFRWYSSAKVCYSYLPDVSAEQDGFQELEEDQEGREGDEAEGRKLGMLRLDHAGLDVAGTSRPNNDVLF